jgi:outer membrane protein assembly factor BamB
MVSGKILQPTITYFIIFIYLIVNGCQNGNSNQRVNMSEVYNFDGWIIPGSIAIIKDNLYYCDGNNNFRCINLKVGKVLWEIKLPEELLLKPIVVGERIIFALNNGSTYIITEQGAIKNKVDFEGRIKREIIRKDSSAIIAVRGQGIYSLNVHDYKSERLISSFAELTTSQPVITGDKLFVGDVDGSLICFNLKEKNVIWKHPLSNNLQSKPFFVGDKLFLGIEDYNRNAQLVSINRYSGKLQDRFNCLIDINQDPIVFNNQIIYQSKDGFIKSVSLDFKTKDWLKIEGYLLSKMIVFKGKLIIGLINNELLIINKKGGIECAINFDTGITDPIIHGNKLYVIAEKNLYSIRI